MKIFCTNPDCNAPENTCNDLQHRRVLLLTRQRYCSSCGTPLILNFHYLPTKLLGKGGFGAAFLARDKQGKQFVVKQLRPQIKLPLEQFAKVRDLFHREAEFLAELGEHDQIPKLYDFFELSTNENTQQQWFYLVQEYINGETLDQELIRKGNFNEQEVIAFLKIILPVIQFIHSKQAIHRDIKPANIMRDRTGKLYLIDFGAVKEASQGVDPNIAIHPDGSTIPTQQSNTSIAIGSPCFASPEQMHPHFPQVSRASDLHALGVTCICLLAGEQRPQNLFNYNPTTNYWDYHNWESKVKVTVSPRLAKIINRMLCNSPQRFNCVDQVLKELHRYQPVANQPSLTISALSAALGSLLSFFLRSRGLAILVLITLISLRHRLSFTTFYLFSIDLIAIGITFYLFAIAGIDIDMNLLNSTSMLLYFIFSLISGLIAIVLTSLSQLIYQLVSKLI